MLKVSRTVERRVLCISGSFSQTHAAAPVHRLCGAVHPRGAETEPSLCDMDATILLFLVVGSFVAREIDRI